jgi:hypothetical protein
MSKTENQHRVSQEMRKTRAYLNDGSVTVSVVSFCSVFSPIFYSRGCDWKCQLDISNDGSVTVSTVSFCFFSLLFFILVVVTGSAS